MKAIILAAGYGSRMYPLAQDHPKCLLPISDDENMLDRQLRILKNFGINDIIVVTGFKKEKIIGRYGKQVSILFNPHHDVTGNAFSLWRAREAFNDDIIVLNSDIVFTEELIGNLLNDDNIFCMVVDKKTCDPEDQKVEVKENLIVNFGKDISIEKAYGEAVGIGKIKKKKIDIFKQALFENVKKDSHMNWPKVFNYLIKKGEKVHFVWVKGPCLENDTKEDYEKTREIFKDKK